MSTSKPSHGSVSVSDGNITYAPNTGYTGTDTLTYNVTDGVVTQQATVTVKVSDFPVFVDNFDDGSLSEYSAASGNTGPSDFTTTSSVAVSGESAKLSVSGTLDGFVASESSGLKRTPRAGDKFQIYVRSNTDSGSQSFIFGKNGHGTGYGVRMKADNSPCCESNVAKLKADGSTLDSRSYNPDANTWYRYVVNWKTNGEMDVSIYDDTGTEVATLSGKDSTYTSGAIELRYGFFNEDGAGYFDEFKITGKA